MDMFRSKLGNYLFKFASFVYVSDNMFLKEWGDMLFKIAAKVSPDKK